MLNYIHTKITHPNQRQQEGEHIMMKDLLKKMEASHRNYFGIRSENRDLPEGYELEPSHDWADGTMLEDILSGTCATGIGFLWFDGDQEDIDTLQKAIDANGGKYGKHIYIIGGDSYEDGVDDSEVIINNAAVIAKI